MPIAKCPNNGKLQNKFENIFAVAAMVDRFKKNYPSREADPYYIFKIHKKNHQPKPT